MGKSGKLSKNVFDRKTPATNGRRATEYLRSPQENEFCHVVPLVQQELLRLFESLLNGLALALSREVDTVLPPAVRKPKPESFSPLNFFQPLKLLVFSNLRCGA